MFGLLVGYELLMRLPLVAGWGHGSFALADNFARWVDLGWPGPAHVYQGNGVAFEPEGLVSALPAAAGTLAGFLSGEFVRHTDSSRRRLVGLSLAGVILLLTGLALGRLEPINKQLWTVSYTALTTGLAQLTLAVCIWSFDRRGEPRWAVPARVFGSNALLAFMGSGLLARTLGLIRVGGAESARVSLKVMIYSDFCVPLAGPAGGSLLYAALNVGLWWAVLAVLYRRRIFIRI
jgi:predicted acyltransferase